MSKNSLITKFSILISLVSVGYLYLYFTGLETDYRKKRLTKVQVKASAQEVNHVVAQTWGWGKLTSRPVWVKSSDPKSEFGDSAWIFQVGFKMGDNKVRTGYCVAPNSLLSTNALWNIGDEVQVAYVSGAGDEPTPSLTYFVIDHKPSKEVELAPK